MVDVNTNSFRVDQLLERLDTKTIEKIHCDPLIKKDERNGLIIANASKKLFTPTEEHHLFAKGIVYDSEFNLVSLPLVKIYNLGEKPRVDKAAKKLDLTEVPHKWDGTMIQIFKHEGDVIYTTRSRFENDPFCVWAREIMNTMYPSFEPIAGYTYVFELIHPDNRIVTDYGDLRDMVLLSVFDGKRYLPMKEIRTRFDETLHVVENLFHGNLREVEEKVRALDDGTEGVVLVFEDDDKVLHRVKVKADYYIELFRMKFACTYKNIKPVLLSNPDLHDWDSFWQYNMDSNTFAEELEDALRVYFDRFMAWKGKVDTAMAEAISEQNDFVAGFTPDYFKEFPDAMIDISVEELCREYSKLPSRNMLVFMALRGKLTWEYAAKSVEDSNDNDI